MHNLLTGIVFTLACALPIASQAITVSRGVMPTPIETYEAPQSPIYRGSFALLIGESQYTAGWDNLDSINRELAKLGRILRQQGFTVRSCKNLDKNGIKEAVDQFINDYGYEYENQLLIVFAGHGHSFEGSDKGFIVPTDAPLPRHFPVEFKRKAISTTTILSWAKNIESKHALFVFDSCFSGTIFTSRGDPTPPTITKALNSPVRQFITSGGAKETVPAQSVFLPIFAKAIQGKGDRNNDGYVTGMELGLYLKDKVPEYNPAQSPQYGTIRDPQKDEGDFIFSPNRTADLGNEKKQPTHSRKFRKKAGQNDHNPIGERGIDHRKAKERYFQLRSQAHIVLQPGIDPSKQLMALQDGAVAVFPPGNYPIRGRLRIKNKIHLVGAGPEQTTISTEYGFHLVNLRGMSRFEGIHFRLQKEHEETAVLFVKDSGLEMENCYVSGGGFSGIEAKRSVLEIISSRFSGNKQSGIFFNAYSTGHVFRSIFSNNNLYGISAKDNATPDVKNNLFSKNKNAGLYIYKSSKGNFIKNSFINNNTGILVNTGSTPTISENIIANNKQSGAKFLGYSQGALLNNTINDNGMSGVAVADDSRPTIKGNDVFNNKESGIFIVSGRAKIIKNTIRNNQKYGIFVKNSAFPIIKHNTFIKNERGDILSRNGHYEDTISDKE